MSKVATDIRQITETDISLLEQCFPQGGKAKHAERFLRQQRGEAGYLIAWVRGQPVGHALLKWGGAQDIPATRQLCGTCPDIEDLFVLVELRSQSIGSQLIRFAEQLARERGYTQIGLSVGAETNAQARLLYEHLGPGFSSGEIPSQFPILF
jgi:GNAT superfamily N-acetyltransferase